MSTYIPPSLNPEEDARQSRNDSFPYGRHKKYEYEKMVEYMDKLRLKKIKARENLSTVMSPNAIANDAKFAMSKDIHQDNSIEELYEGKLTVIYKSFPVLNEAFDYADIVAGQKINFALYSNHNNEYTCSVKLLKPAYTLDLSNPRNRLIVVIHAKKKKINKKQYVTSYFLKASIESL